MISETTKANNKVKKVWLAVVSILLVFIASSASSMAGVSAKNQRFPNYASLMSTAQNEGSVKIFVGFEPATGYLPEAEMSIEGVDAQRAAIQTEQTIIVEALSAAGLTPEIVAEYNYIPFIAMNVDAQTLDALTNMQNVIHIEERMMVELSLDNSVPHINGDVVHTLGFTGAGQTVVIIDSGIQADHPTFGSRVVDEACYSTADIAGESSLCPNGLATQTGTGAADSTTAACLSTGGDYDINGNLCYHGTHVASIAAGSDATYTGVAPDANIVAVQVFHKVDTACTYTGPCIKADSADIISGFEYAYSLRNTYDIASVNLSLGAYGFTSACDQYTAEFTAAQNLVDAGIAVIAASGNSGYTNAIAWPACMSNVISVAATNDSNDGTASFNNISNDLDLFAPGVSIYGAIPTNGWGSLSGTSMAAPHVAGAWAVVSEAAPTATIAEILNAFQTTGAPVTQDSVTRSRIDLFPTVDSFINILDNSAAELIKPDGWEWLFTQNLESGEAVDCGNGNARTGSCSFVWSGNGTVKTSAIRYDHFGAAGDTIEFSLWRKGQSIPATGSVFVKLVLLHSDGSSEKVEKKVSNGDVSIWTQYQLSITATESYRRVDITLVNSMPSGTVWMDDFSMKINGSAEMLTAPSVETWVPDNWQFGRNLETGEGAVCGAGIAYSGICSFGWQGNGIVKEIALRYPKFGALGGSAGDTINFSLYRLGQNIPATGSVFVKLVLLNYDGSIQKLERKISSGDVSVWTLYMLQLTADKDYKRIDITIVNSMPSGTVWMDDFSLSITP